MTGSNNKVKDNFTWFPIAILSLFPKEIVTSYRNCKDNATLLYLPYVATTVLFTHNFANSGKRLKISKFSNVNPWFFVFVLVEKGQGYHVLKSWGCHWITSVQGLSTNTSTCGKSVLVDLSIPRCVKRTSVFSPTDTGHYVDISSIFGGTGIKELINNTHVQYLLYISTFL